MHYWLMKSEPSEFSIDDLVRARAQTTPWVGVRNYQARNFMRDMKQGELALFYHSSCPEPGIAGIVEIAKLAHPDVSQFDKKSPYYDAASKKEAPRWFHVDVRALRKTRLLSLAELREEKRLAKMRLLRPGNRLSITPVSASEWRLIGKLLA